MVNEIMAIINAILTPVVICIVVIENISGFS